ncbi:hypothetical protein [Alcanivorax sp. 1008]|uniref:hypothetical protein n=1 Tax=Alcanivorax sp. 1008 TaxID=2816853 RepID=UPI001DF0A24F|nr:hypothetical protein [Alcanivorax sp. 1008]MCC1497398.1 hypothetical protein [Alcanivorax sp. 1008]
MSKLQLKAALFSAALLLTACSSAPINYSWYSCVKDSPVVATISEKQNTYQIFSCERPKPGSTTVVEKRDHTGNADTILWKMPSGKSCKYYGRNPASEDVGSEGSRQGNMTYGLRYPGAKVNREDCYVDIGFMQTDRYGIITFRSTQNTSGTKYIEDVFVHPYQTKFENGRVYADAFFIEIPTDRSGYINAVFINADGVTVKHWGKVEKQTFEHDFLEEKGGGYALRSREYMNYLFRAGNNLAFVSNEETKLKYTPDIIDSYSFFPTAYVMQYGNRKNIPPERMTQAEQIAAKDARSDIERRSTHKLHIISGDKMEEVKTLLPGQFKIQPMVDSDITQGLSNTEHRVIWNVIGPLQGTKGLYGFLQEDGTFQAPPGTLGVKPAEIMVRLNESGQVTSNTREGLAPKFWLVAYDNQAGGYSWGKASADFALMTDPLWNDIAYHADGWLFAQPLGSNKWISLDEFHLTLPKQEFASIQEGMNIINAAANDLKIAIREEKRQERIAAEAREAELVRQAWIDYRKAKNSGDVAGMKRAANVSKDIAEDFLFSSYATDSERSRYVERNPATANILLQKHVAERQRAQEEYIRQQQAKAAFAKENAARIAEMERREQKRKDLEAWRSTVNENMKRTNNRVQQDWNKHQTEMYEKGYISLPD